MANEKISIGGAVAALILNILILPGLGTVIFGKTKTGIFQLIMAIAGFLLIFPLVTFGKNNPDKTTFLLIGILLILSLMITAWVWGLVTGIKLIKKSK